MKIPTILGLSVIITAFILGLMFYIYKQTQTTEINQDYTPKNIRITNITPNSFTVSWFTDQSTNGSLSWGKTNSLGSNTSDDRDNQTNFLGHTHHTTVTNLTPSTTYSFKIRSGPFFFPQSPLTVTTAADTPGNNSTPLIGTVSTPGSDSTKDTLVFFQTPGGSDLSGYVTQNNNFLIPLANLRTGDLQTTLSPTGKSNLVATDGKLQSYVTLILPNNSPISITLGQNFDLSNSSPSATIAPTTN